MKQSIQLRLGHNLTMTPQLQQAIRLLQLSTLDLRSEIQEVLESNAMLELDENEDTRREGEQVDAPFEDNVETTDKSESDIDMSSNTSDQMTEMPNELPVDSNWEDTFDIPVVSSHAADSHDTRTIDDNKSESESLQAHLRWQLELTQFSNTDRVIADVIIDAIDENGYLSVNMADVLSSVSADLDVDADEVEAVLHSIQFFDPPGVGARDLRECLLIQLQLCSQDTPHLSAAQKLVGDYLDLLGKHDYVSLMRKTQFSEEKMKAVVTFIRSLNPRPGSLVGNKASEYIVPDVMVTKKEGKWLVELNADAAPRLRVNASYAGMIRRADNSVDNTYLKNSLQEARWFLKSLQSRNETLLKVSRCIVERQRDFLEYGEEAMKALVLNDIAQEVDMHESTISRVTTQKYMHTSRGIFELKYFFSSHVATVSGGECSATAIRALIKKLVAAEDCKKPLSDNKIAQVLEQQGIKIARRTVAKYREALSIMPSNERKRLM